MIILWAISLQSVSAVETEYKSERVEAKKMQIQEMRWEMRIEKEMTKWEIIENRNEAKENRKAFREENKAELQEVRENLTDDQQSELENTRESFKNEFAALREEMKQAQDDQEKEAIREEIDELKGAQFIKIGEIIWESALVLIEERKAVSEENESLREESREIRAQYKANRKEQIDTYRDAFVKRIWNRLDNIPTANLEKAAEKIDAMLEKIENDETMSEERKQARLDAVLALKEIVEDRLENDESEEDILEIFSDILED